MAKFEDLTPYTYFASNDKDYKILNIGWLAGEFSKGKVPNKFLIELEKYKDYPRIQTRGFHNCPYCGNDRSSNEIRVISKAGIVYASPMLVIHYIKAHNYKPPDEYINAVLDAIEPGSNEYERICQITEERK